MSDQTASRYSSCSGMVKAALAVKECKDALSRVGWDTEAVCGAVLGFVRACDSSMLCLSLVRDCKDDLLRATLELEGQKLILKDDLLAHYFAWAARAILIGHKEAALPTTNEQLQHLVESRSPDLYTYCKNFADLRLVHNLLWLLHAGQFKVLRSLATAPDNSRHSSEASSNQWGHPFANRSSISRHTPVRQMAGSILHLHSQPQPCKQARRAPTLSTTSSLRDAAVTQIGTVFEAMHILRPKHPVTLQAAMLLQDLPGTSPQPISDPADIMQTGYYYAMDKLAEPAIAIQHLLICVYHELQRCNGRPPADVQARMSWGAHKTMFNYHMLQDELQGNAFWDIVCQQLVASMMLLGRSFNLAKILPSSEFVSFVEREHKQLQKQFAGGKSSKTSFSSVSARSHACSNTAQHVSSPEKPQTGPATGRCKRIRKKPQQLDSDQHF